jgi:type IX secretion system PorP/SprF family membrane protein
MKGTLTTYGILLLLLLGSSPNSVGQMQATYSNFLLNEYYFNPAISGSRDVHTANMSYRNQWTGFEDAPTTLMGNFNGSIKNQGKHGYGVSLVSDRMGLMQNTGVYLNYAYHIKLGDKLKLGLGMQPGYVQYRIRLYDARIVDAGDDILTGNIYAANAVDLNSGIHLYSKKFFFMASVHQLLGQSIEFTSFNSSLNQHFVGIVGYTFENEKTKLAIQPALLIRHMGPFPTQWNAMLRATYDKKYWGGLVYRSNDAAAICAGIQLKERYTVGYSFDYSLSRISQYQNGTHEITLSFITSKPKAQLEEDDEKLNNSIMEEMQKRAKENK